jgi:hypothetical protein
MEAELTDHDNFSWRDELATLKPKRTNFGLEMKTFKSTKSGQTYLVFKRLDGGYHAFVETEAKAAADDCGAKESGTRLGWNSLWK